MVAKIEQLVTDFSQGRQGAAAEGQHEPDSTNTAAIRALALTLEQQTASILQNSSQQADNWLTQMQQLLFCVQQLHGCLREAVAALQVDGEASVGNLSATEVAAAAIAAQQQLKATLATPYSLRHKAQEVKQLISRLYSSHVTVPNLSTGHALLQQLQRFAKHHPQCIELSRLKAVVNEQIPCAEVYCQYVKLVSQLRKACRFQSCWVQQKLTFPSGVHASLDKLYAAAPAATEFMMQLCGDVLGSFDTTPTSIALVRQYQQEQLQHLDQQLVSTLLSLMVPEDEVDGHGWRGLLMSFQELLTAEAADRPMERDRSAAQQQLQRRRALLMSNAELKLQQKHELLNSLSQQVEKLLQEAKGTKPCPNVLVSPPAAAASVPCISDAQTSKHQDNS